MKPALVLAGVAAALAAVFLLRGTAASQSAAPQSTPGITVLVTLGQNAKAMERWDGSLRVTGGSLARIEGWHFSAADAISGAAWKCATRRDEIAPYADIHYTEMRPGARPAVLFHPVGLYVTVVPAGDARLAFETAQGSFGFALSESSSRPRQFLDGRVSVAWAPSAERLSTPEFQNDEAALVALPGGGLAAAWVAYRDRADRVLLRTYQNGNWSSPEEVTPKPGDVFRCSLAADETGNLWVFWSEREGDRWQIWARRRSTGSWHSPERLSSAGSNTFHRAASRGGSLFVVWQSTRDGQSDIYMRAWQRGAWSQEVRLSESAANDWEPAVAVGNDGTAYFAWDSYARGNYDVFFRSWRGGSLSAVQPVTSSPLLQAHASLAVDAQGRPWLGWDESGVNWGKDQGFLIPTPLATPLHRQRSLRVVLWDGSAWRELPRRPAEVFPLNMRENAEHPQLAFDGKGALVLVFRHWTRRNSRTIGSPIVWENYLTRFDGETWTEPVALAHSTGSIEKHAAVARDTAGEVWAAWMTDGRPFATAVPNNAEIYCARLGAPQPAAFDVSRFPPFSEPFAESIPVHVQEASNIQAVRSYAIEAGGRRYRIYRGDMHRHSDVSQDFKYDGSLIEVYRYARDAAGFDYILPTDHQAGYDQEFTWWQGQKLADLFFEPGRFTPLFGYERSVPYPNGHRNVVFAERGVRTLPIPPEERDGQTGAARLYEYLRRNHGISMPHSTATAQGTDWRDNDPQLEPLMEIYQGYRTSYEYEGAPRAASRLNPHAQKSGWQPEGFWWNALAKGYRLGVQSSSDHWSTHVSYACILADTFTREGLLDAMRRRHSYAATDNIVLDFRARAGGATYLMGDALRTASAPQLWLHAAGTGAIQQIDVVKNQKFIYTSHPGSREAGFEFTDRDFQPGQGCYYYVRVLQQDGQLAWSSPIWIER